MLWNAAKTRVIVALDQWMVQKYRGHSPMPRGWYPYRRHCIGSELASRATRKLIQKRVGTKGKRGSEFSIYCQLKRLAFFLPTASLGTSFASSLYLRLRPFKHAEWSGYGDNCAIPLVIYIYIYIIYSYLNIASSPYVQKRSFFKVYTRGKVSVYFLKSRFFRSEPTLITRRTLMVGHVGDH